MRVSVAQLMRPQLASGGELSGYLALIVQKPVRTVSFLLRGRWTQQINVKMSNPC